MDIVLLVLLLHISYYRFSLALVAGEYLITSREEILDILKGRYNYASFDCAARVLATNKGCKSAKSILQSTKDTYLLNLCAYSDKHIVLELCQDIRIDTLVLANFEYFSSMVKGFRVSVSKKYPVTETGWRLLGHYTAENSRREQIFPVQSTGYARYLRIDLDTHYGNEYYCLLSVVRVYGKTMMEDFEESAAVGLPAGSKGAHAPAASVITLGVGNGGTPVLTDSASSIRATVVRSLATVPGPSLVTAPSDRCNSPPMQPPPAATNQRKPPTRHSSRGQDEEDASDAETQVEMDDSKDLGRSMNNLMNLFRRRKAQNSCRAAPTSFPSESEENTEIPGSSVLEQENVFKAIYDRLQQLERNVTKSTRNVKDQLGRLEDSLHIIQDEIGVVDERKKGEEGPKGRPRNAQSSFRARMMHHLERRHVSFMSKALGEVQDVVRELHRTDRLLFWLAVFVALQVSGLVLIVVVVLNFGWFTLPSFRGGPSRPPSRLAPSHRRASTLPPITASQETERFIIDETESQVVPGTSSAPIISPSSVGKDQFRGMSPLKGDLIETAARPLLLDETEAELIDATYVSSPLSPSSSPSSTSKSASMLVANPKAGVEDSFRNARQNSYQDSHQTSHQGSHQDSPNTSVSTTRTSLPSPDDQVPT